MRQKRVILLTQSAMIAAVYVVLCLIFAPISYKEVQIRVAEALTILPVFTPAAVPGLMIGCLISNVIGGAVVLDVVCGSLATLIGALGTWMLRKKNRFWAPLPPILANVLIVPWVLRYGYGLMLPVPVLMLGVGIGEVISCGVLGLFLHSALQKSSGRIFRGL